MKKTTIFIIVAIILIVIVGGYFLMAKGNEEKKVLLRTTKGDIIIKLYGDMPITVSQKALAEQHQWAAANDGATQIRVVAGPGTGKSHTIEKRVAYLLNNGVDPQKVHVISFTRATCTELGDRIQAFCSTQSCASVATHKFRGHNT